MITLPLRPAPTNASKKWNPSARSSSTKNCEGAMDGVGITTSSELGSEELHPGLGELSAHQHRQQAADEQEEERGNRVLDADHLVVGVDAEVVAPRAGAVGRMVLGPRRPSRRPVKPVVAGPDPDQE